MDTANISQTSDYTRIDYPKGVDSRVPIEMWYRRAWTYQGVGVSEALNVLLEGMLR